MLIRYRRSFSRRSRRMWGGNKLVYFVIIFFFMLLEYSFCQSYPIMSQDPPGIKWQIIETEHFEIIFPQTFNIEAQRIANRVEAVYRPVSSSLRIEPDKIPIVLHNQTIVSNGFVALAPRRSEWFTMPPQSPYFGVTDWMDLLSVHEFRHVVQLDKTKTGMTKYFYYLTGDVGWTIASFIAIPLWYWEGDAVGVETALLSGGRGKLPRFDMGIRTILLNQGIFPYEKAVLRSFKDYYPDHYPLGYLITTYVKRKYGTEAWDKIITRTSRFPIRPFAFSSAIKKTTGMGVANIYYSAMLELTNFWRKQQKGLSITGAKRKNVRTDAVWTNYRYPKYLKDGRLIALKYGLDDVENFVVIDKFGQEKSIHTPGNIFDVPFSSDGRMLVWSEMTIDKRWWLRDYSTIKVFDTVTEEERTLIEKSRLLAPSISPNGREIVAVEYTEDNNFYLVFISAETGVEYNRISSPDNDYIVTPAWSDDGKKIVFIRMNKKGQTISILEVEDESFKDVTPYTDYTLSGPVMNGNYIYYTSSFSGIDNIYIVDQETRQISRVTSRKYGAFDPVISRDGTNMLFNDYTVLGFNIAEMSLNKANWEKIEDVGERNIKYYEPLIAQERDGSQIDDIRQIEYKVEDYTNQYLFNFHSWLPYISPYSNNVGFSMYSTDILNSLSTSVGYTYHLTEKTNGGFINLSYQKSYPVIDLEMSYIGRSSFYPKEEKKEKEDQMYSWDERNVKLGLRFPAVIYRGKYSQYFEAGINTSLIDVSNTTDQEQMSEGNFLSVTYNFTYSRKHKTSPRSLSPPFGQSFSFQYSYLPFEENQRSNILYTNLDLLFPGLMKHHSIRTGFSYSKANGGYSFTSGLMMPRGYFLTAIPDQLSKGTLNYALPLLYPDLRIGPFFYFKRFKANLFIDYGIGKDEVMAEKYYRSVGLEFVSDVNFMRFIIPFEPGLRFMLKPGEKGIWIELILFGFGY